jgi:hypothetical protein
MENNDEAIEVTEEMDNVINSVLDFD